MTKRTAILYAIYVALVFSFPSCVSKKTHNRILKQERTTSFDNGFRAGKEIENKACQDTITQMSTLTPLNAPQSKQAVSAPAGKRKKQKKAITVPTTPIQDGCK